MANNKQPTDVSSSDEYEEEGIGDQQLGLHDNYKDRSQLRNSGSSHDSDAGRREMDDDDELAFLRDNQRSLQGKIVTIEKKMSKRMQGIENNNQSIMRDLCEIKKLLERTSLPGSRTESTRRSEVRTFHEEADASVDIGQHSDPPRRERPHGHHGHGRMEGADLSRAKMASKSLILPVYDGSTTFRVYKTMLTRYLDDTATPRSLDKSLFLESLRKGNKQAKDFYQEIVESDLMDLSFNELLEKAEEFFKKSITPFEYVQKLNRMQQMKAETLDDWYSRVLKVQQEAVNANTGSETQTIKTFALDAFMNGLTDSQLRWEVRKEVKELSGKTLRDILTTALRTKEALEQHRSLDQQREGEEIKVNYATNSYGGQNYNKQKKKKWNQNSQYNYQDGRTYTQPQGYSQPQTHMPPQVPSQTSQVNFQLPPSTPSTSRRQTNAPIRPGTTHPSQQQASQATLQGPPSAPLSAPSSASPNAPPSAPPNTPAQQVQQGPMYPYYPWWIGNQPFHYPMQQVPPTSMGGMPVFDTSYPPPPMPPQAQGNKQAPQAHHSGNE